MQAVHLLINKAVKISSRAAYKVHAVIDTVANTLQTSAQQLCVSHNPDDYT